ncbi:C40 family peptidase [Nocardia colli]|uniref:C40 family peptidase n=1 Tax=Nocardia colli TaxID=2545717 RepID=UPI0035DE78DD
MSPELSGEVATVLQAFQRLYGDGEPQVRDVAAVRAATGAQLESAGLTARGYSSASAMQTAVAETQAGRDTAVQEATGRSGDSTVTGRNRLSGQIADFETRMKAIATVADTRFSGPAMLSTAQLALDNATRQVNADIATARQVAAQIMPPAVPQPVRRNNSLPPRRRRGRGRGRGTGYRNGSGPAGPGRIPHDSSAGSTAVQIASSLIGTPFGFAGNGPADVVRHAIAEATDNQVVLPHTTYEQIHSGRRVNLWDARQGDLVFPADSFGFNGPEHVQLADGRGGVIEVPHPGAEVRWAPMPSNATVVRVLLPRNDQST